MDVFELHYPGTWPDNVPNDKEVKSLFNGLEAQLAYAALGLHFFLAATTMRVANFADYLARRREETAATSARLGNLEHGCDEEYFASGRTRQDQLALFTSKRYDFEKVSLEVRREQWAAGQMPTSYEDQLVFIHAHTVLYALDTIDKMLDVLRETGQADKINKQIEAAVDDFRAAVPGLQDVRDSAHHLEDRSRWRAKGGKQLDLKPVHSRLIKAEGGGVLALSNLDGNRLGYTASDGSYIEVEISRASVAAAQTAIQAALDAFPWKGGAWTSPR
jgi:D-lyxose ketol-isomerase